LLNLLDDTNKKKVSKKRTNLQAEFLEFFGFMVLEISQKFFELNLS